MPQRQEIKEPQSLKDYASIILYYDTLVQEWESWGQTVEEIIDGSISVNSN